MPASFRRAAVPLFILVQALSTSGLLAQQGPAGSPAVVRLTLKGTVQLALKQNPQRIIARIVVYESERNSQIARSALLPQADIAANGSLNQYNIQAVQRQFPRKSAGPYQLFEAGPTFSQSVLNLPLIRGYQIGREGTREARADELTVRQNVVTAVVDQYLMILRALATRDAAKVRVELAQRLYEQAAELQKTGIGLNIDTVRANVELQNEKQNLIDSETQVRTKTSRRRTGSISMIFRRWTGTRCSSRLLRHARSYTLWIRSSASPNCRRIRRATNVCRNWISPVSGFIRAHISPRAFRRTPTRSRWNFQFLLVDEFGRRWRAPNWRRTASLKFVSKPKRRSWTR